MSIFTQFFKSNQKTVDDFKHEARQELMRKEREVTGTIFGDLEGGTKRDFFCLNRSTWIWYEEWVDKNGQRKHMTTRYEIRPTEIVKSQNGGSYQQLSVQETRSLKKAAEAYVTTVNEKIYSAVAK